MSVVVFVEGGSPGDLATQCRRAFGAFFAKLVAEGNRPQVIACGPRHVAFDKFKTALADMEMEGRALLLLVDSERAVARRDGPWDHLRKRPDGWSKPRGVTNSQAHLMVECMESWFLADADAVASYYGHGFRRNALPRQKEIEKNPKTKVIDGLDRAGRLTGKKGYHKTRDGFALLALIDPAKVRKASPHAEKFFVVLERESSA